MTIHAHEKVRSILEGEYGSVFKGRSMDFDDLREYIPGDDIKDIDWKATARSGATLIKRYVAIRKHNIMLVVNTGRDMAATAQSGENKKDIAVMIAGVVGYIALKHGDLVGLTAGDEKQTTHFALKGTNVHLERILQHINGNTNIGGNSGSIVSQLEYIAKTISRRMMLVVINDDSELTPDYERVLRRLRAQHEILWVSVGDASGLDAADYYDIDDIAVLGPLFAKNQQLIKAFEQAQVQATQGNGKMLERLGIISERIVSDNEVVQQLYRLLERHKHARQR